ncbi:MAG: hypothetical protein WBC60_16505 [Cognaticolwellia sp.]
MISFLFLMLSSSFLTMAGKKDCQKYRKKLDDIQELQRQPNNLKRSNSLAKKEDKARNTWWRCENGKLTIKPKKKKKRSAKKIKSKKQKKLKSPSYKYKESTKTKPLVPFASSGPVVGFSAYKDEKLQAWLLFYQPEKKCSKPKTTQQFVACAKDKRRQQAEFEKDLLISKPKSNPD